MADLGRRLAQPSPAPGSYDAKPSWEQTEAELAALLADSGGDLQSLIDPLSPRDADYAGELAQLKRFIERWRADAGFREKLPADPAAVAAEYGLQTDPELLRAYWDDDVERAEPEEEAAAIRRYRFFTREKLLHREMLRCVECVPSDPGQREWRDRQIRRSLGHLGAKSHDGIVHAPFAIELSDGCSVGCWFCGVSAKKKGGDYEYRGENIAEWRGVLGALRERLGPAAATGFLYWASDPLDNPDYEKFGEDFAEICGRFPQTTTSIAHKDIERTRRILRRSTELGCTINRFSILSLGQFNKLMEAFTPEELLYCELVCQNAEGTLMQSSAGKARGTERLKRRGESREDGAEWSETPGTIACVSGYLINMVTRTIQLITPCPASPQWPNGYWVLDRAEFETVAHFDYLLGEMQARHFRGFLRYDDAARFRSDLRFEAIEGGFRLHAYGVVRSYGGEGRRAMPHFRELGEAVAAGRSTAGGIAVEFEDRFGLDADRTFRALNFLFDAGELDEEPVPGGSVAA